MVWGGVSEIKYLDNNFIQIAFLALYLIRKQGLI